MKNIRVTYQLVIDMLLFGDLDHMSITLDKFNVSSNNYHTAIEIQWTN